MIYALATGLVAALIGPCFGLGGIQPLDTSAIVRPYGPIGRYAGHWGVDLAMGLGGTVRAAGSGTVTFAGSVAGRLSVTIHHGGGVRTSYSYLATIVGRRGESVGRGEPVGTSGIHDGREAFHFSLRLGDEYVDPVAALSCPTYPGPGLFLAPSQGTYAVGRARNSRRYVRSSPRGPPGGRTRRL